MRLENRIALITGAGRGIGRAIAEQYGREGARVAVADLTLESAREAVDAIEKAGGTAMALAMDVTDDREGCGHVRLRSGPHGARWNPCVSKGVSAGAGRGGMGYPSRP